MNLPRHLILFELLSILQVAVKAEYPVHRNSCRCFNQMNVVTYYTHLNMSPTLHNALLLHHRIGKIPGNTSMGNTEKQWEIPGNPRGIVQDTQFFHSVLISIYEWPFTD